MKKLTIILVCVMIIMTTSTEATPPLKKTFTQPLVLETDIGIAFAQPFKLVQGYIYDRSKDRPFIKKGILLVLKVDPDLVIPRDAAHPLLMADQIIVQTLNHGHESGNVVAIVPGDIDLSTVRFWFAKSSLYSQISTKEIDADQLMKELIAIKTFDRQKIDHVMQSQITVANLFVLLRDVAADLVLQYSPEEKSLAKTWRLPVAKR